MRQIDTEHNYVLCGARNGERRKLFGAPLGTLLPPVALACKKTFTHHSCLSVSFLLDSWHHRATMCNAVAELSSNVTYRSIVLCPPNARLNHSPRTNSPGCTRLSRVEPSPAFATRR